MMCDAQMDFENHLTQRIKIAHNGTEKEVSTPNQVVVTPALKGNDHLLHGVKHKLNLYGSHEWANLRT